MNGIVNYDYKDMTEDEQRKYNEKIKLDASIKNMFEEYKKLTKGNIDYSKLKLAEGFSTYKTPSRWLNFCVQHGIY